MAKDSVAKSRPHLPTMGVGPAYVISIILLSILAMIVDTTLFHLPHPTSALLEIFLFIVGLLLILFGLLIYFLAIKAKITRSIKENTLVTHGVYSVVRNPIYSAWLFICTGTLFLYGNPYLALLLFSIFWLSLTILMKHTEEKWLTKLYGEAYLEYCKRVNRCLPWFPNKFA
ncbi:MAG: isoprenylcysteine carboxylmethyltransferase family protein [Candidatus Nanosynbacter sp.]|nr:isoprenylcysteine carboxylmethyltransferase family protein [Candidatus Nanosynbacter sp.]